MSSKLTLTENGKYISGNKGFLTVEGVHRKAKKAFLTVSGTHKLCYSSGITWAIYGTYEEEWTYGDDVDILYSSDVEYRFDREVSGLFESYSQFYEDGEYRLVGENPVNATGQSCDGLYAVDENTAVYQLRQTGVRAEQTDSGAYAVYIYDLYKVIEVATSTVYEPHYGESFGYIESEEDKPPIDGYIIRERIDQNDGEYNNYIIEGYLDDHGYGVWYFESTVADKMEGSDE